MDQRLVERMNKKKPTTMKQIEDIWYQDYNERRERHYHESRYHFLYEEQNVMKSNSSEAL
jgi:hypothetical protein